MRLNKRRLLLLIAVLVIFTTLLVFSVLYSRRVIRCTEESSRKILQDLCQLYREGKVAGNLCGDLCVSQALVFNSCLKLVKGNKHVMLLADWNDDQVVLKTKYSQFQDYHPAPVNSGRPADGPKIMQQILDQVKFALGIDVQREPAQVLRLLWPDRPESGGVESMTTAQLHSLWSLLLQDEYLFLSYFAGQPHLPRVRGSCGHLYAVEYTPAPAEPLVGPFLFGQRESPRRSHTSWPQRLGLAMGLLELVRSFDNAFPEPLHLCDVKPDNFGVRPRDQTVTAVDVDIVFFERRLTQLLPQPTCRSDADCDFFDCRAKCNILTKTCRAQRSNNNLQAICEKIFMPDIMQGGLLRNPPEKIQKDLKIALFHCMYASEPGIKASETEAFQKLKSVFETAKNLL